VPRPTAKSRHPADGGDGPEDIYASQREELLSRLTACVRQNQPLTAYESPVLSSDEAAVVLQKIKNSHPFSRKERRGLLEAGFAVDKLYPRL